MAQQQTYETEMIKNMYTGLAKDLIAHLEKNGALKIDTSEALALLGLPKKVSGKKQLSEEEKAKRAAEKQRKAEEKEAARLAREQAKAEKAAEKERTVFKRIKMKAVKEAIKIGRKKMKEAIAAEKAAEKQRKAEAKKEKAKLPKKVKNVKINVLPEGHIVRPKGRSPKGKTWDTEKGEWVDKEE